MKVNVLPVVIPKKEAALYPGALRRPLDVNALFAFRTAWLLHVNAPKIAANMENHMPAVGGGFPDVVFLLEGLGLEVAAVRVTGVEVADALVVRDKPDAVANPLGTHGVSG